MATLGTFVRQRIHEMKKQQKEVALDIHDHLEGEGAADKPQTIEQKLSKLLNGNPEGGRYFTDPSRLQALAHAVGCAVDDLTTVLARSMEETTLVLDPRLPEEAVEFLEKLSSEPDAGFLVAKVGDGDTQSAWPELRDRLRDRARAVNNPLVTLSTLVDGDCDFFAGASLRVCQLIGYPRGGTPRGWITNAEPNPVHALPPPPPERFDEDGTPLLPSELLDQDWASLRSYSYPPIGEQSVLFERWQAARSIDSEARYPILAVIRRHLIGKGRDDYDVVTAGSFVVYDDGSARRGSLPGVMLLEHPKVTHVWLHDRRLFVRGPGAARVEEILGDHHTAYSCEDLMARADDLLHKRNPWREFRPWDEWDLLCAEMLERSGVQLAVSEKVLKSIQEEVSDDSYLVTAGDPRSSEIRAVLREIASRPMQLTGRDVWLMARLQAVAEAPLIVLGAEPGRWFRTVADLGCGNLLKLFVQTFPAEQPSPLSIVREHVVHLGEVIRAIDGGDVRFQMWLETDQALEGQRTHRNRVRREEEEEARRAREDD